jgi:hypothetical protein
MSSIEIIETLYRIFPKKNYALFRSLQTPPL